MIPVRHRLAARLVAVLAVCTAGIAFAQAVIPPLSIKGPYPTACTNAEQDFSRVQSGETADMYWRGVSGGGKERYVDALLVSPAAALTTSFTAPDDDDLYDRWANQPVRYVFLACYPTSAANARADYTLPGGDAIPRMQRGDEAPIMPSTPARWPVLLYSHGYAGSPLSGDYLRAMLAFASWGYVVVAPFHGDLRYSAFGPDAASAAAKIHIPVWSEFVAMQALRALSASTALDVLLARADWRDRVDPNRIAAFGISQGGETLMLLGGAALTYDAFHFDAKRVTLDARVRAAVGYVPYFGIESIPAFGDDQSGAQGLALPYLALSGTADPIAPADVVRAALGRMAGPRGQVLLVGQGHELDPSSSADIVTWALTFLFAWGDNRCRGEGAPYAGRPCRRRPRRPQGLLRRPGCEREHGRSGRRHRVPQRRARSLLHHGDSPTRRRCSTPACHPAGRARGIRSTRGSRARARATKRAASSARRAVGPNSHFYTISLCECALVGRIRRGRSRRSRFARSSRSRTDASPSTRP